MKDIAVKIVKTKKEEGFTLLEIIVAISILTVGLLAVASMQLSAIRGNAFAEGVTEATSLAVDYMEYLMGLDYDDDTDQIDPEDHMDDVDDDGTNGLDDETSPPADHTPPDGSYISDRGMEYNIYWNTARNQPAVNTTTIRVIVTWRERGIQRRVFLDFIRANI